MNYEKIFTEEISMWNKWDTFSPKQLEDEIAMCISPMIIIPKPIIRAVISEMAKNKMNPYPYTIKRKEYDFYGENIDVEIFDISYEKILNANAKRILVFDRDNEKEYKVFYFENL